MWIAYVIVLLIILLWAFPSCRTTIIGGGIAAAAIYCNTDISKAGGDDEWQQQRGHYRRKENYPSRPGQGQQRPSQSWQGQSRQGQQRPREPRNIAPPRRKEFNVLPKRSVAPRAGFIYVPALKAEAPDVADGILTPDEVLKFQSVFVNAPKHKHETMVRAMFEDFSGHSWPEVTGAEQELKWLRRVDSTFNAHWLDFDGYNDDHKAAFEYQGPHHYKYSPGVNVWLFANGRANDIIKKRLASDNDVHLMEIFYTTPLNKLANVVKTHLAQIGMLKEDIRFNRVIIPEPQIESKANNEISTIIFIHVKSQEVVKKQNIDLVPHIPKVQRAAMLAEGKEVPPQRTLSDGEIKVRDEIDRRVKEIVDGVRPADAYKRAESFPEFDIVAS